MIQNVHLSVHVGTLVSLQRNHLVLALSQNYPGKFLLSYLPRNRCRHEYITVTPEGFRFRAQMFSRVNDMFRWFKEHFRDPLPGQSTPSTPRGAMTSRTPYTTPGAVSGEFPCSADQFATN